MKNELPTNLLMKSRLKVMNELPASVEEQVAVFTPVLNLLQML